MVEEQGSGHRKDGLRLFPLKHFQNYLQVQGSLDVGGLEALVHPPAGLNNSRQRHST
jgi:hypothetical protein